MLLSEMMVPAGIMMSCFKILVVIEGIVAWMAEVDKLVFGGSGGGVIYMYTHGRRSHHPRGSGLSIYICMPVLFFRAALFKNGQH